MHVFVAQDLKEGQPEPMGDERIETRWFTSKELDEGIQSGKIQDGKTISAYLAWKRWGR